ncbi:YkvA family protein [Fusobacterium sp.]|uniref:YkvA family protein n=1 Tax=Fusobacterium sp. TaxID=68766 RepID=UPI00262FE8B3|nr:YkvA family protein [Fusobacterium sp.]
MKSFKENPEDILEGEFIEEKIENEDFNTSEYREFFKEDSFWSKIKNYSLKIGLKGIYFSLILYYLLKKNNIPLKEKTLIISALGYLIAPLDFIPDILPGMGFVDDIGALTFVIKKVSKYIDEDIKLQAKLKLQEWFKDLDDLNNFI